MISTSPKALGRRRATKRGYALLVLSAVYGLAAADAVLFSILLQPLKVDMQISDTQIGFLVGISVAIFNVLFTIPIGRLADLWKRTNVVAISIAVFGITTALCGFATNIWQLIVIRVFGAIGESGSLPSSTSLIADLYPESSRGTAMAIFVMGGYAGSFLAYAVGGVLVEKLGWRGALGAAAVPGVMLALLIRFSVPEPARDCQGGNARLERVPLSSVLRFLWQQRSLRHLVAGSTLVFLYTYGVTVWLPSYFERSFGMGAAETGFFLGVPVGVMALLGMVTSGIVGDRLSKRDVRWRAWIVALAVGIAFPVSVGCFLAPSKLLAVAAYGTAATLTTFYAAPTFALVQSLSLPRMRAVALAVLTTVICLVGRGLGPQIVGVLSDTLHTHWGQDSLRYGLLAMTPALILAAAHFYWAGKYLSKDMQRATEGRESAIIVGI